MSQPLIEQAIRTRTPIEATFAGDPASRLLCPTILGYKAGADGSVYLNLLSYQIGGYSKSGLDAVARHHNWRCKKVAAIHGVKLRADLVWETVSPYTQPSSCVDQVIVQNEG